MDCHFRKSMGCALIHYNLETGREPVCSDEVLVRNETCRQGTDPLMHRMLFT